VRWNTHSRKISGSFCNVCPARRIVHERNGGVCSTVAVACYFPEERKWFDRTSILLYASWLVAGLIWFAVRSQATLKSSDLQFSDVVKTFPIRLPVLIQYLGKGIFLPFNLNVFPITQDTIYFSESFPFSFLPQLFLFKKPRLANDHYRTRHLCTFHPRAYGACEFE
jgi:hypothetical protein